MRAAWGKFEEARRAEVERSLADREKARRADSEPGLSAEQRLALLKSTQGWSRIVLGLYVAELAAAQSDRRNHPPPEYGRLKPSEIAQQNVGDALGLGPDRVRELCQEGRRHLQEGMPLKQKVRAAEFRKYLEAPRA